MMIALVMLVASVLMLMSSANASSANELQSDTIAASTLTDNAASTTTARSGQGSSAINGHYITQLLSGMLIVVICIMVLAWFARRMNRFSATADGSLQILAGLSMGSRERIVLLQVGDRQLLLGVAPGRISTLHVLDEPLAADAAGGTGTSFSQHLVDRVQAHLATKRSGQERVS